MWTQCWLDYKALDKVKDSYEKYFKDFEKKGIIVLKHHINYGKGRALKTALNYILNEYKNIKAIITADSDGQHSPEDIEKVANVTKKHPEAYVLGSRNFKQDNVPFKSRYGNIITRNVFKIFVGLNITDTQTGLRGMSPEVLHRADDPDRQRLRSRRQRFPKQPEEPV